MIVGLWGGLRAGLAEDEGTDERTQIDRWIDRLGADRYAVREEARLQLEREGARAAEFLRARVTDPDPEIRRSVRLLLDRLGGEPVEVPVALPGDLEALGTVRMDLAEARPVGEVLRLLGEPFGARFELPEDAAEVPVELDLEEAPFFAAVHAVASAVGLVPPVAFEPSGVLRLREGEMQQPWAAAGPIRVRVTEVGTTRSLAGPEPRQHTLTMDVDWPPAFQPVWWQTPREVSGEDGEGGRYGVAASSRGTTTYGVGASSTGGRFQLHLQPEGEAEERLAVLRFRLPLRLRHDRQEQAFVAPFDDLPREVELEGSGRLTLLAVEGPDQAPGPWSARVAARLEGEVPTKSLQIWFELEDGRRQVGSTGTRYPAADGRVELSARAWLGQDAVPRAVIVTFFEREEYGELPIVLEDVPLR